MDKEIDQLISEIAVEIKRLNVLHVRLCELAPEATVLPEAERDKAWSDLDFLSGALRRALASLQSGTIRTSFFSAEPK